VTTINEYFSRLSKRWIFRI